MRAQKALPGQVSEFEKASALQTQTGGAAQQEGMTRLLMELLREGRPSLYFRGAFATLCRDVPFSGIFIGLYSFLKSQALERKAQAGEENPSLHALHNFACGAVAAATASAVTHPFDVLRTRLQLSRHSEGPDAWAPGEGLLRGGFRLCREEGALVLFRGLGMRLVKRSLMAAMTWSSFDELKKALAPR